MYLSIRHSHASQVYNPRAYVGQVGNGKICISLVGAMTDLQAITPVDVDGWSEADSKILNHYAVFGDRLPTELATALDAAESSLS